MENVVAVVILCAVSYLLGLYLGHTSSKKKASVEIEALKGELEEAKDHLANLVLENIKLGEEKISQIEETSEKIEEIIQLVEEKNELEARVRNLDNYASMLHDDIEGIVSGEISLPELPKSFEEYHTFIKKVDTLNGSGELGEILQRAGYDHYTM